MRFIYPTWEGPSAYATSFVRWERSHTLFKAMISYDCVLAEKGWDPPLRFALSIWRLHAQVATWAPWFRSLHVSDRQSNPDLDYGVLVTLYPPALMATLRFGWRKLRIEVTPERKKRVAPYQGYKRP